MGSYAETIKIAILVFPFVAFMISTPFILIQYHKYGSISFLRAIIIYSFVLYFICAYFLIILPLPKISGVALLTTPRVQLIPFHFIIDFINETSFSITNIHTYLLALKESCFYVPIFNLILTIPFGVYLRYYFKCDLKKTIFFTFILSLFYELTQLSGLYFIYSRGYRLCDVDDLIINTLGGLVGYYMCTPVIKLLPDRDKIDEEALEKGKNISGFRRTTSFLLDLFIVLFIGMLIYLITDTIYTFLIVLAIYYFIIPSLLKCSTLGQKFLNIKVVDKNNKANIIRLAFRNILFACIYFVFPYVLFKSFSYMKLSEKMTEFFGIIIILIVFSIYSISAIKYLFTHKTMMYEKISKTKLISTIK